jgi:hypothetical protein
MKPQLSWLAGFAEMSGYFGGDSFCVYLIDLWYDFALSWTFVSKSNIGQFLG